MLSPDKTLARNAFCLVLNVSGRTGGEDGAARAQAGLCPLMAFPSLSV